MNMNIFNPQTYFSMLFSFVTELLIAALLLMPKKNKFRKSFFWRIPLGLLISYGTSVGCLAWIASVEWGLWVNIAIYTLMFVAVIFSLWLVFDYSINRIVLLSIVAYTIQHMAYQTGVLVLDTGLNSQLYSNVPEQQGWLYNLILYSTKFIVYVLCYFGLARIYAKNCEHIFRTPYIVLLAVGTYLVVVVVNSIAAQQIKWWLYSLKAAVAGALIMCCILFDYAVIVGFMTVERREKSMLMERTMEAKLRQYEMTEENIAFINMKCHDLRKQVRYLKTKKDSISDDDLQMLEDSLRLYDVGVRTGKAEIDVLIQDKQLYCKAHDIEFTALVDGEALSSFDRNDAFFLMMNIIDNAIEAVEKVDDKEKRVISLVIARKNGLAFVEESNYFQGQIEILSDGSIRSSGEAGHGYGTRSIAYVVHKYKGEIKHDIQGDRFFLKIVM